ncbi:MAG: IS5 family transposase [Alphaproteobacteria bacterium]|nr:IS5 family transposase [Alphaproteobacteria bacterium]
MSFLASEARVRIKDSPLLKLRELIEWNKVVKEMGSLGRSGYGPTGYDPLKLLKALILQAWHSLSDVGLEEALRVRLDFMLFTGFDQEVPDATTLCRFRNLLTTRQLWKKILRSINTSLEDKGLKVAASHGAILDATIIESAARPRKSLEALVEDRLEEEGKEIINVTILPEAHHSVDPDARWLKKGKKSYFGYKGFAVVDGKEGYIDHIRVKPANASEVRSLEEVIKGMPKTKRLYGDKGYASQNNREHLRGQKIKTGLMYKASRGHDLSSRQKKFNRLVSGIRYRVEQCFGTLKRRFRFTRASYFSEVKVEAQMILKAISFNLLKAYRQVYCV